MDISAKKKVRKKRPPEKSLRFPVSTHEKLIKLCDKLGRNQVELFIAMVDYFYRTKKDPADVNDEVLKNALAKNHDTYIRFIRSQEDNLLIPMKENMDRMITNQREIVRYFNEQVLNANKSILQNQQVQAATTEKLLKTTESKDKLKIKFLFILNQYIRQREEIGSFKGREKEELMEQTRKQVNDL